MNPVTELKEEPRPLRADARRNHERILVAARKVLADEGYEAQMSDIARAANVGIGTVYRHFPDKTALVEALVAERFTQFAELSRKVLEAEDVWVGFREWLERCGEIQAEDKMVCDFIAEALSAERGAAIAKEVGLEAATREAVEHAKRAGALRQTVEPDDIGPMMCGLGAIARSRDDAEGRIWRRQLDFMLEGMREPSYSAR